MLQPNHGLWRPSLAQAEAALRPVLRPQSPEGHNLEPGEGCLVALCPPSVKQVTAPSKNKTKTKESKGLVEEPSGGERSLGLAVFNWPSDLDWPRPLSGETWLNIQPVWPQETAPSPPPPIRLSPPPTPGAWLQR